MRWPDLSAAVARCLRWLPQHAAPGVCVWGKLPTHADFLRHNTGASVAADWQGWLHRNEPPRRAGPAQPSPWMHLSPARVDRAAVPVAFALPPGSLAFSGAGYVAGVMAASSDRLGRRHPLVVWRCVSLEWLMAQACLPGWPWWHAQAQGLERWMAVADGTRTPEAQQPVGVADADAAWHRLCNLAAELDRDTPTSPAALHARLASRLPGPADEHEDDLPLTASGLLRGVPRMPWPGWPQGDVGVTRQPAFWQQDGEARIVSAAFTLAGLLRAEGADR